MRRWTVAEDALLREMYSKSTSQQLASALGRTGSMIRDRCWKLGLNQKVVPWSEVDVATVRNAYEAAGNMPVDVSAIAKTLGRTRASVFLKASRLGLASYSRHRKLPHECKGPKPRMYATKEELSKANSERTRRLWQERGHPRGMLGIKHTAETLAKMSAAGRRAWANPASAHHSAKAVQRRSDQTLKMNLSGKGHERYSRTSGGRRPDLGNVYFRSSWEANYARYLNLLLTQGKIVSWEYEPKTFIFEKISLGTRSYTPDFRVVFSGDRYEWHEVKGWMDPKSRTRLTRMKIYFPKEPVIVFGEKWFRSANKGIGYVIPNWERKGRKMLPLVPKAGP